MHPLPNYRPILEAWPLIAGTVFLTYCWKRGHGPLRVLHTGLVNLRAFLLWSRYELPAALRSRWGRFHEIRDRLWRGV